MIFFIGCGGGNSDNEKNQTITQTPTNIDEGEFITPPTSNIKIDENKSIPIDIQQPKPIESIKPNIPILEENNKLEDENLTIPKKEEANKSKDNNSTTQKEINEPKKDEAKKDEKIKDESNKTEEPTQEQKKTEIQKFGKAQLGVMANATVKLYEIEGKKEKLLATEQTSSGETIEDIGNFNLNINLLDDDKFYLYKVVGGMDYDIEDDGIINENPTENSGVFHLLAKGSQIKNSSKINITIVSEIIYQKILPFLDDNQLENKISTIIKEIIQTDINDDKVIDIADVFGFNPIIDKKNLTIDYQDKIFDMINNILNGKAFDYQKDTSQKDTSQKDTSQKDTSQKESEVKKIAPPPIIYVKTTSSKYPTDKNGLQQALDSRDYDYVIDQLTNNKNAYDDMDKTLINQNIAGAYVGKSGYTVFDITGAMSGSGATNFNSFVSNISKNNDALSTIEQLENAQTYYEKITKDINCSDINLSQIQKDNCFNHALVKLTSLANSVKLLFGGDENIVKKWADGIDVNSSEDLNGNGVIDNADASACAIIYANTPNENCKNGTIYSYRGGVTFIKNGINYNLTLIDVDVGHPNNGYKTFHELVTSTSPILTKGICETDFTLSNNAIDGVKYFPCPVLDKNNQLMTLKESLDDNQNIQNLLPDGTETKGKMENYLQNMTGSKNGVVTLDNLSNYLQK